MAMDCQETSRKLSAFLDGELREAEQVQIRRHLDVCPRCAADHENLAFAWERALEVPRAGPRTDLWPRLEARLATDTSVGRLPWLRWSPFPALVTAALVVGLLLGLQVGALVLNAGAPSDGRTADVGADAMDVQYLGDVFPGSLADAVLDADEDTRIPPGRMTR